MRKRKHKTHRELARQFNVKYEKWISMTVEQRRTVRKQYALMQKLKRERMDEWLDIEHLQTIEAFLEK